MSTNILNCPICDLEFLLDEIEDHVNKHFKNSDIIEINEGNIIEEEIFGEEELYELKNDFDRSDVMIQFFHWYWEEKDQQNLYQRVILKS